eukprot:s1069_g14.t1
MILGRSIRNRRQPQKKISFQNFQGIFANPFPGLVSDAPMGTIESVQAAVAENPEDGRHVPPGNHRVSATSSDMGPGEAQLIEVQKLLSRHGVNTSNYGREGCLTVKDLAREVSHGQCRLETDENGKLLRNVSLVEVTLVVRITGGRLALVEEEQILDDGRRRQFMQRKLHGKLMRKETPVRGAWRCVRERLGLAFKGKLSKLRRAAGLEALEPSAVHQMSSNAVGTNRVGTDRVGTDPVGLSKASEAIGAKQAQVSQGDDYGKYGVTKSNLKQAENQLKSCLKKARLEDYWGKEGLGSGPHINLFESAELEVKRHCEEHAKLLRYQGTNNNLAEKSRKRPLSEFDEMTQELPWYMKAEPEGRLPAAEVEAEAGSDVKRKKHGQMVLRVSFDEKSPTTTTVDTSHLEVETTASQPPQELKQKLKDKDSNNMTTNRAHVQKRLVWNCNLLKNLKPRAESSCLVHFAQLLHSKRNDNEQQLLAPGEAEARHFYGCHGCHAGNGCRCHEANANFSATAANIFQAALTNAQSVGQRNSEHYFEVGTFLEDADTFEALSSSYPGLRTRYVVHRIEFQLPSLRKETGPGLPGLDSEPLSGWAPAPEVVSDEKLKLLLGELGLPSARSFFSVEGVLGPGNGGRVHLWRWVMHEAERIDEVSHEPELNVMEAAAAAMARRDSRSSIELGGGSMELARSLEGLGWNVQRLATLSDASADELDDVVGQAEESMGRPVAVQHLRDLVDMVVPAAKIAWRAEGRGPEGELLQAHLARQLQDKLNAHRSIAEARLMQIVPRQGTAKVVRWPTRLLKKLDMAGENQALRDSVERNERNRWIKELKVFLDQGEAPVMKRSQVVGGVDMTRRFGKGRRASTLRKHVKTWKKVRDWMAVTFDKYWPEHPEEFALYLESRANEPCGRTVPGSIFKTLLFMENAGEFPVEQQLGRSPAIKNVLEEISMQLAERAPKFTRKAWHFPVKVVLTLEEMVLDCKLESYVRCYAWYRLIKLWSGMRFSDTQGMDHKTLEWQSHGVTAVLTRTKTTGPGKKISLLRIWVSQDCWLQDETWISTGYELWLKLSQEAGLVNRDFMLPAPSKDLSGFIKRMASYSLASRCSQAMFKDMMTEFEGARIPLFSPGVGTIWSEHTERATIKTWSSAAGVPPEIQKQLGRWSPTVDQGYERTWRANTLKAQARTADFVRHSLGKQDPFDEALLMSAITERMEQVGHPAGVIELQLEKLAVFGKCRPRKFIRLEEPDKSWEQDVPEVGWHLVGLNKGAASGSAGPVGQIEDVPTSDDEETAQVGAEEIVPRGTYVLSIWGRGDRKTLHRVGECHRVPGVHYSKYEVVGNEPPESDRFHQSCRICFPRGTTEDVSDSEASDEEASSSDSSTSVEESDD